jgi:Zn-dependent peptidase ImmA (M78 family)
MKSEQLTLQFQAKPLHPYAVLDSLFDQEEMIASSVDCSPLRTIARVDISKSATTFGNQGLNNHLQPAGNPYANIDSSAEDGTEIKSRRIPAAFNESLLIMSKSLKNQRSLSDKQIEETVRMIHRSLWIQRNELNKVQAPGNPIGMLDPAIALAALGYKISRPATLGTFSSDGVTYEVAGQINQKSRTVEISQQFPRETQYFTAAHELAHAFMHDQLCMHRDRPLNGSQKTNSKEFKEWQADRFATYYLMPEKLIKRYFHQIFHTQEFQVSPNTAHALNFDSADALMRQCRNRRELSRLLATATIYNSRAVRSMSEIFNVSTEAMAIRLEELGLVNFPK